jgi:uncharacterized membrane protein
MKALVCQLPLLIGLQLALYCELLRDRYVGNFFLFFFCGGGVNE